MSDRLSRFWSNLRKEKWLILLCLVLSFCSWQLIRRNISFPLRMDGIPVEIDVPQDWAVLNRSFDTVDVRLLGSREDIRDLSRGPLRIVVPIPEPERGTPMVIELLPKYLKNNPTAAKVVSFNPAEIEISLDQEQVSSLPVKATLNGSLPDGLEIERIVCKPATVLVTGAKQQLESMDNIHTEPIDLKNRQSSFKENVRIQLPQGGRLEAQPDRVSVEFILEARNSQTVFEKVPVRIMCSPGERRQIDIQPRTINITVRGQQHRMELLRSADIFAYVSCTELTENTGYDLPVIVDLPSGLQAVKTDPPAVHVEIGNSN